MKIVNEKDNGKKIILNLKELLEINLIENPSTGFIWVEEIVPSQVLLLEKEEFVQSDFIHGGNSTHRWIYRGNKPGERKIRFLYQRLWVKSKSGEKQFELDIQVLA